MFDLKLISVGRVHIGAVCKVRVNASLPLVENRLHADRFVMGRRKLYRPTGSGDPVACFERTDVLVHHEYICDPRRFVVFGDCLFRIDTSKRQLIAQVSQGDISELKGYGVTCLN